MENIFSRRKGRELVVQLLVQFDINPPDNIEEAFAAFWQQQAQLENEARAEPSILEPPCVCFGVTAPGAVAKLAEFKAFVEELARGVFKGQAEIDTLIGPYLTNWSLGRLGTVERNVLRLGFWELTHRPRVPGPVVVNEAVDVAKFFSTSQSGRFVNAVLDRYAKDLKAKVETFIPQGK